MSAILVSRQSSVVSQHERESRHRMTDRCRICGHPTAYAPRFPLPAYEPALDSGLCARCRDRLAGGGALPPLPAEPAAPATAHQPILTPAPAGFPGLASCSADLVAGDAYCAVAYLAQLEHTTQRSLVPQGRADVCGAHRAQILNGLVRWWRDDGVNVQPYQLRAQAQLVADRLILTANGCQIANGIRAHYNL
jgi:hypothetical protein